MSLFVGLLMLSAAGVGAGEPDGTVLGIDVSHHSGEIDWRRVEAQGYSFVYLKASEGVDDPDPLFRQHWKALAELGLPRGAYHFYVTEDDPEQQAQLFLSQVELEPGDLAPVVDIELLGHGTTGNVSERLQRFLDLIENELGVTPIIYTSPRFWTAHLEPTFGRYPLWVAEYEVDKPTLPHGWSRWHLWQFEGDAEIAGVEKSADRSRLHPDVSLESLRVGAGKSPTSSDQSSLAMAQRDSASIDQMIRVAEEFFLSPGASWVKKEQPFWKHHVVLKLESNPDYRLVHRPSVAVDNQGHPTMLSDGCFRVSQQKILNGFNLIALAEAVQIDRQNIVQYAQFVVATHLLSRDTLLPVPKEAVSRILADPVTSSRSKALLEKLKNKGELPVEVLDPAESVAANGFQVGAYLWNWKGGWIAEYSFAIHTDGSIELGGTKYRNQPNPSDTSTPLNDEMQLPEVPEKTSKSLF